MSRIFISSRDLDNGEQFVVNNLIEQRDCGPSAADGKNNTVQEAHKITIPHRQRDASNMPAIILDALEGVVYDDDRQVQLLYVCRIPTRPKTRKRKASARVRGARPPADTSPGEACAP